MPPCADCDTLDGILNKNPLRIRRTAGLLHEPLTEKGTWLTVHQHTTSASSNQTQKVVDDKGRAVRAEQGVAVGVPCDNRAAALGLSTAHISPPHLRPYLIERPNGLAVHYEGVIDDTLPARSVTPLPIGLHENPLRNITSIGSPNAERTRFTVNDKGGITTIWAGASLIQVKRPPKNDLLRVAGKGIGGQRSYVSGFSGASRLRLMRLLATLRRDCVPIFITLTYPSSWPNTPKEWKRHLDTLAKRLRRRFPDCAMVWKLEAQRRGAPHFHCLLYGVYKIPDDFRTWLSLSWYEIVASGDERHLRAGSRIEYLRSYRGAMSYAAKYMDKTVDELPEEWGRPGRFWGVTGREYLPVGEVIQVPLSWSESVTLQRWVRRYAKLGNRDRHTETVFVNVPEDWLRALDGLQDSADTGVNRERRKNDLAYQNGV